MAVKIDVKDVKDKTLLQLSDEVKQPEVDSVTSNPLLADAAHRCKANSDPNRSALLNQRAMSLAFDAVK